MACGQAPVALSAHSIGQRITEGVGPRHLAPIRLLPYQAGDVVRHRAIPGIGERGWVDHIIGILPGCRGVVLRLAGIRKLQHAPRTRGLPDHLVEKQAAVQGGARGGGDLPGGGVLRLHIVFNDCSRREGRNLSAIHTIPCGPIPVQPVIQHRYTGGVRPRHPGECDPADIRASADCRSHPHRLRRSRVRRTVRRAGNRQWEDHVTVSHHAVCAGTRFIRWKPGANIVHPHA